MIETLNDAIADILSQLERGASSRKSAMHTPVVATADADQRVMVLREFDESERRLRFHTDARSPKCVAIGEGALVSVLFYDFDTKTQIRARGTGRIEQYGPIADAAWDESTTFARRCYLAEDAPGAVSEAATSGLPDWAEGIQPSEDQVAPARENFAVLLVTLEKLDWLYLANTGHRRAIFSAGSEGLWNGRWVVP